MSVQALLFMIVAWSMALGLAGWSFWRILSKPEPSDAGASVADAAAATEGPR